MLCLAENAPTTRSTQCLVCREGDNVCIRHRIWVSPASDKTRQVSNVKHQQCTNFISNCFERFWIKTTWVTSRSRHNHLGTMLQCKLTHVVEVDALITGRDSIRLEVIQNAAGIHRRTVCEVAAVVETKTKNCVAWVQKTEIDSHVCAGTRVWLHVRMICTEEFLHTRDCECFDYVGIDVAAVVTLAGISLGILIREDGSCCLHHCRRGEVLAGNQLQTCGLTNALRLEESKDFGVWIGIGRKWHYLPDSCCSISVNCATRRS